MQVTPWSSHRLDLRQGKSLGFKGLGFRVSGFRGLGFRVWGFSADGSMLVFGLPVGPFALLAVLASIKKQPNTKGEPIPSC